MTEKITKQEQLSALHQYFRFQLNKSEGQVKTYKEITKGH